MHITRQIVKVGNSAGVILPRDWLHGTAQVTLLAKPLDVKKDIFELLDAYLEQVLGIYVTGSYARGEHTSQSDIDVLVITKNVTKKIVRKPYECVLIAQDNLESSLRKNALPLLPMIREARPILNVSLLEQYRHIPLTHKNLSFYLASVRSACEINEGFIELGEGVCSDSIAYSLVLHLRSVHIVDALLKGSVWTTPSLTALIQKVTGSLDAYSGYIRVKQGKADKNTLPREHGKKLIEYIRKKIEEHTQWTQRKDSKK